jgi:hypothetical protein
MTFWFYMAGVSPGSLTVVIKDLETDTTNLVWRIAGQNYGDTWNYATFGFYISSAYKVWIEGARGSSRSFIAIDDIVFKESFYCSVIPNAASVGEVLVIPSEFTTRPTTPTVPSVFDCNFEINFCTWRQTIQYKLQWIRQRGATPSSLTGPLVDHT